VYFEEVFSSYLVQSYRSALVMLWTVLICDLWFKIEDLSDRYDDEKAKELLAAVKKIQMTEKKDLAKWENSLVDGIFTRLSIIDPYTKQAIDHLKEDRNLCAHPTLTSESLLFSPSKEKTIAHIRSILETVLTKPPFLGKEILSIMLKEIAFIKDSLATDEQLGKYISAKYMPRFQSGTLAEIYRGLWKMVFRLEDVDCVENRSINFRILQLIFKKDKIACLERMKADAEYFNSISNKDESLRYLVDFLISDFDIWDKLSNDIRVSIEGYVHRDINLTLKFYSSQGSEQASILGIEKAQEITATYQINLRDTSPNTIPVINCVIKQDTVSYLYSKDYSSGFTRKLNEYFISKYSATRTYADADIVFGSYIKPFLKYYIIDDFKQLVVAINSNDQTYCRWAAVREHSFLVNFLREHFPIENIKFIEDIQKYDELEGYIQEQSIVTF